MVTKRLSWQPAWVWLLLLLGMIPALVVAAVMSKSVRVSFQLCEEHSKRRAMGLILLTLGPVLLIGGLFLVKQDELLFGLLISLPVCLIVGAWMRIDIGLKKVGSHVWFVTAGAAFTASLPPASAAVEAWLKEDAPYTSDPEVQRALSTRPSARTGSSTQRLAPWIVSKRAS